MKPFIGDVTFHDVANRSAISSYTEAEEYSELLETTVKSNVAVIEGQSVFRCVFDNGLVLDTGSQYGIPGFYIEGISEEWLDKLKEIHKQ